MLCLDKTTMYGPLTCLSIGSCGSYLDGGASHAFQEAAVPMLDPELVHNEMIHLQRHFRVCYPSSISFSSNSFVGQA